MTPALAEQIIGAIGVVLLVALVSYYLMTLVTPEAPFTEYDSARRAMMRGD